MRRPIISPITLFALALLPFAAVADVQPKFPIAGAVKAESAEHPFLDTSRPIIWDRLHADLLVPDVKLAIKQGQDIIDRICAVPDDAVTYANTFGALEGSDVALDEVMGKMYTLKSLCDTPALRQAVSEASELSSAYLSGILANRRLWHVLKHADQCLDKSKLTAEQKRFMELSLHNFHNNGADLPPDQQERLATINQELAKACQTFAELCQDSRRHWLWVVRDESLLDGLDPADIKHAAEEFTLQFPKETGPGWAFTPTTQDSSGAMKKLNKEEARKQLWEQMQKLSTGEYDTAPIIHKILSLRDEQAKLCGFPQFSDYALQESMAGNGQEAVRFVDDLLTKAKEPFFREMEGLRERKAKETGDAQAKLNPWDVAYYINQRNKEEFQLDENELQKYFPLQQVLDGVFNLAHQFYGITVTEIPVKCGPSGDTKQADVWNPTVRYFRIDDSDGKLLGHFYLDLFSRKNKRTGGWMAPLDMGKPAGADSPERPKLAMICLNVPPPHPGKPVLLQNFQAKTLFHEFGHLLHVMFSKANISSLAGTNVPRDFVEVPSLFMENWAQNENYLKQYAKHYETGEPIPDAMVQGLIDGQNSLAATELVNQLLYSKLDLYAHLNPDQAIAQQIDKLDEQVFGDFAYFKGYPKAGLLRTGMHFFSSPSGYASFYFSYRWAEVLEKDIYDSFNKEHAADNKEVAAKLRRTILENGYTIPPMEQFINFKGRKPSPEPMLKSRGLDATSSK